MNNLRQTFILYLMYGVWGTRLVSVDGSLAAWYRDGGGDGGIDIYGLNGLERIKFPLCVNGKFECDCITEPYRKMERWGRAHESNKEMVTAAVSKHGAEGIDVVFLGDSITEGWIGNMFTRRKWPEHLEVFSSHFHKDAGGRYEGLPLGITGDLSANLLWRIQNGEIDELNPKVFWILIGINDLLSSCSPEAVTLSILKIVKEIRDRKPSAVVVVNGILPASSHKYEGKLNPSKTPGPDKTWPSIISINEGLERFCFQSGGSNVEYFEAEHIFRVDSGKGKFEGYIPSELMRGEFIHPTAMGYDHWGKEIVEWLDHRFLN